MKFQEVFDFDFPARVILHMFGQRNYYVTKFERMNIVPESLDMATEAGRLTVSVRHALDVSRLRFPEFVKSMVGDHLHLHQIDTWQLGAGTGTIALDIEKVPVRGDARLRLSDYGAGSRLVLDFNVKASVPLFGSRIEKAVSGPIRQHIRKEMTLSQAMASQYASL